MSFLATLKIALAALRVNKLRSALTMLGIIIGVGAVIAMTAIGAGAQARVEDQIRSLGSNLIIVLPGNVTSGGVRMGSGAQLTLSEDDAAALPREVPEIEVAAPQLRGGGQVVFGNSNWSTQILGVTPDYLVAREWEVASGRPMTGADVDGASKVALVGQTVARTLFGESDPVGETIRIRNVPHEIVGLLDRKGQSMIGQDQDDVVLIPISTARKRVLGGQQVRARNVGTITVKVRQGADVSSAEQQMRELLRYVATNGTGRNADTPGYDVGGKTGSAEVPGPNGRYIRNALRTSFAAVFPMYNPRYAVMVLMDQPKATKETFGFATAGYTAAPQAGRIIQRIAPLLGVPNVPLPTKLAAGEPTL